MLGKKVAVDLGTQSVRLLIKGENVILSEPAVVGYDPAELGVTAVYGAAALRARVEEPRIHVGRPITAGSVADEQLLYSLIGHLLVRAVGRQRIFKPDLVIAVMSAMSGDDRRVVLDAAMQAGARTVYLIDSVMAGAIGAGVSVMSASGHLVVDMGAGKTDIALLAMESTIAHSTLPGHGGEALRDAVAARVQRVHGVTLEPHVAEDVVASLLSAGVHEERTLSVDAKLDGAAGSVTLTSTELAPVLDAHLRPITAAVQEVLGEAPVSLRDDVEREGIIAFGGGARLEGFERHLGSASGLRVRVDGDPLLSVIRGAGYALDNLDVLKRNFMYIR